MTKGLRTLPEDRQVTVAMRRAESGTGGLGCFAARNFLRSKGIKTKADYINDAMEVSRTAQAVNQRRESEERRQKPKNRQQRPPFKHINRPHKAR